MKNLFSSLSVAGEWGAFLYQNEPNNPNLAVIQTGELQKEVAEEVKTVEKDTETALNSASTQVELSGVQNGEQVNIVACDPETHEETPADAPAEETPAEETPAAPTEEPTLDALANFENMKPKEVRALFKDYAEKLDGKEWYDEATGDRLVVQTFVPKSWFTFKRAKIDVIRTRYGNPVSKREIILGRGNRIVENEYTKEVKYSNVQKTEDNKMVFKNNTENNEIVDNYKQPSNVNKDLISKEVTKEKVYWAKDKDEKVVTKMKEKDEAKAVFQTLENMVNETPDCAPWEWCGIRYVEEAVQAEAAPETAPAENTATSEETTNTTV